MKIYSKGCCIASPISPGNLGNICAIFGRHAEHVAKMSGGIEDGRSDAVHVSIHPLIPETLMKVVGILKGWESKTARPARGLIRKLIDSHGLVNLLALEGRGSLRWTVWSSPSACRLGDSYLQTNVIYSIPNHTCFLKRQSNHHRPPKIASNAYDMAANFRQRLASKLTIERC
jgi:hypothetical protein